MRISLVSSDFPSKYNKRTKSTTKNKFSQIKVRNKNYGKKRKAEIKSWLSNNQLIQVSELSKYRIRLKIINLIFQNIRGGLQLHYTEIKVEKKLAKTWIFQAVRHKDN